MTGARSLLEARARARRGAFQLDAALDAAADETLAVVGPSGAGKTTLLRLLAGADRLDAGRIALGGRPWDEPGRDVLVPAEERAVGWVPQGESLFPHLDAAGNVAFGMRCRGTSRGRARVLAGEWLERVGLPGRGGARVGSLSGGEGRRVALARALAVRPRVLLLDEPFAGLDVHARPGMRDVVRDSLGGRDRPEVRVLVAHDPLDVLALADRVAVLEEGEVAQVGTPAELCAQPRTPFVAELAGVNLLRGRASVAEGRPVVEVEGGGVLRVADRAEGAVVAVFRPSAVALYRRPPAGSPRNVLEAVVAEVAPAGERVRVRLDGPPSLVAELTADAAAALALGPGEVVHAAIKATEIDVIPAPPGRT